MNRLIALVSDCAVIGVVCAASLVTCWTYNDGENWLRTDGYGQVMLWIFGGKK